MVDEVHECFSCIPLW